MNAGSLRLRLFAGAGLWIGLALVVAGIAISYLFASNVERATREQLSAEFTRLVSLIEPEGQAPVLTSAMPDSRYSSLFGGYYWQISAPDGDVLARSRSLWDTSIEVPAESMESGEARFLRLDGPDGQRLTALVRQISFSAAVGGPDYSVLVAQDRAALDQSIRTFAGDLIVSLVILGSALMLAAWLQISLGLAPLQAIRSGIDAVRFGKADRLEGDFPTEVQPLVRGVNDLLQSQDKSMQFARARASDLAHGLKTPMAVLGGVADKLRASGDDESAELVHTLSEEMAGRIDYQLRLSRLRMRDTTHSFSTDLNETLRRAVGVVDKTSEGERLRWQADLSGDLAVDIDQQDLVELVGVLLENAAKWASSRVGVKTEKREEFAIVTISDDGPGVSAGKMFRLGERGKRLDESKPGYGLGLAIAHEIVEMNRGSLIFESGGAGGGLTVKLTLPRSAA